MICFTDKWVCPYSSISKHLKDIKIWINKIEKAFLQHGEDYKELGYKYPIGFSKKEKDTYKEKLKEMDIALQILDKFTTEFATEAYEMKIF